MEPSGVLGSNRFPGGVGVFCEALVAPLVTDVSGPPVVRSIPRESRRPRESPGQKAIGGRAGSTWNLQATKPNEIWSYDFVAARTDDGLPLRILNVVDEFTRRCLGCRVDRSIGSGQVAEVLAELFARHGRPRLVRSDNGREFIAASLKGWLDVQGVGQVFIEKGSPQQNAYVERFNGSMRDEKLNGELFRSVLEARVVLAERVDTCGARTAAWR
ncbi:DDE-type integrase/transposase/recombinase [Svornostia abyssi]|uniref:DDE-type integrase/transposase/recombinase n=1 Tax=Svornostia abyssi TaxID=2898438 RepID=A0ABY5PKV0_9ACTN|nr:DDE-type integrase/transposase/recombinase [Parviterribacteraceae bacterium J379]